jgi:hypothetical protein
MNSLTRGKSDYSVFEVARYHTSTEVELSFWDTLQGRIQERSFEFFMDVNSVNQVRGLTVITQGKE